MENDESWDDDFEVAFMSSNVAKSIGEEKNQNSNDVSVPEDFGFAFKPYDIQQRFMREMYRVLDRGQIGIFESPTGTGKSLSLLCASLSWLKNTEAAHLAEMKKLVEEDGSSTSNSGNWLEEFEREKQRRQLKLDAETELKKRQELEERLSRAKELILGAKRLIVNLKRRHEVGSPDEDAQLSNVNEEVEEDLDADLVLEDYSSEEEASVSTPKSHHPHSAENGEEEEPFSCRKVYFCSRTHSQLDQVVKEVKKTNFADGKLRVVTLGSRRTLCINERVSSLRSLNAMNEACLQMQLNSASKNLKTEDRTRRKKGSSKCPYFRPEAVQRLADQYIDDIEDLLSAGRRMAACPYYASRYAVPAAELVLLPYQMILHWSTRQSCNLPVRSNALVVDEAHNLLDALDDMYSSEVDGSLLEMCSVQLNNYLAKYAKRLNAKNLVYVRQIAQVVANFVKYLKVNCDRKADSQVMTINDFTFATASDAINWFKVLRYIDKSQLCRKMRGFAMRLAAVDDKNVPTGCFNTLTTFFRSISGSSKDYRLIYFSSDYFATARLKVVCLNPATHVKDIFEEAHAVVLAGGTLEPVDELYDRLFDMCSVPRSRIFHFSCGHIVPKENLLPMVVNRGPTNRDLRFNYQLRTSQDLIFELGQIFLMLATVVPGGIVCFLSSYGYLSTVHDMLSSSGMLQQLQCLKRVFMEPRNATQVPGLLKEYGESVQAGKKGAMLFAVVGGKMSEGINFSDDLGRCVVMVGLPYANIKSIELQTKMNFLNALKSNSSSGAGASDRGNAYFSNLCFKAVNQSIGRAIRHRNDYASILLVDCRFHGSASQAKLPKWIKDSLAEPATFAECCDRLKEFYADCKSRYPDK